MQWASSEASEIRLKRETLVWVDLAVDGRLDSHSGLDSELLIAESIVQSGYRRDDDRDAPASGAGVFGGENVLALSLWRGIPHS